MAVWEQVLANLKNGARLIKKRRAEPAWELLEDGELIMPVYNNTVTALYSRNLITHRLDDEGLEAILVTGLAIVGK